MILCEPVALTTQSNAAVYTRTNRTLRHSWPVLKGAAFGVAWLVSSSEVLLREKGSADCRFLSPCAMGLATCSVLSLGEERGLGGDLSALMAAGAISGMMPVSLHKI